MTPAGEQLRQEKEAFDQAKAQAGHWFVLQLCTRYASILGPLLVAFVCSFIIFNHQTYGPQMTAWALGILGGDLLALMASIWRNVLNPGRSMSLRPFTRATPRRRPTKSVRGPFR